MSFLAKLFKEEPKLAAPSTGINAILLGPPGSGKGTQVTVAGKSLNSHSHSFSFSNSNIDLSRIVTWMCIISLPHLNHITLT